MKRSALAQLDILRRCIFSPYRAGMGPRFHLTMWDTHRRDHRGQTIIGYTLAEGSDVIFTGEDFAGSPMHADDADETVASLMGFLTLRPGDTDADYFAGYSPRQLAYCAAHAEYLDCEVSRRFEKEQ